MCAYAEMTTPDVQYHSTDRFHLHAKKKKKRKNEIYIACKWKIFILTLK